MSEQPTNCALLFTCFILSTFSVKTHGSATRTPICGCFISKTPSECFPTHGMTNLFLMFNDSIVRSDLYRSNLQNSSGVDMVENTTDLFKSYCNSHIKREEKTRMCQLGKEDVLILYSTEPTVQLFVKGFGKNKLIVCENGIGSTLRHLKLEDLGEVQFSRGAIATRGERKLDVVFKKVKTVLFPTGLSNPYLDQKGSYDDSTNKKDKVFDIFMRFEDVGDIELRHRSLTVQNAKMEINGAEKFVLGFRAFILLGNGEGSGLVGENIKTLDMSGSFGEYVQLNSCNKVTLFHEAIPTTVSSLSMSNISLLEFHKEAILAQSSLSVSLDNIESLYYADSISFPAKNTNLTAVSSKELEVVSMSTFYARHTTFEVYNRENHYLLSRDVFLTNVTFKRSRFIKSNFSFVASNIVYDSENSLFPDWLHLCARVGDSCQSGEAKMDLWCPEGYYDLASNGSYDYSDVACRNPYLFSEGLWINVLYAFVGLAFIAVLTFLAIVIGIGVQRRKLTSIWKPESYEMNSTTAALIANEERFLKYSEILHICEGDEHVVTTLPRPSKSRHPPNDNPTSKRSRSSSQIPQMHNEYETGITLLGIRNHPNSKKESIVDGEDEEYE